MYKNGAIFGPPCMYVLVDSIYNCDFVDLLHNADTNAQIAPTVLRTVFRLARVGQLP